MNYFCRQYLSLAMFSFDLELIVTGDGSPSIFVPSLNEHYHSVHGAVQESTKIFLSYGFDYFAVAEQLCVFEVGFGTGLNACLTAMRSKETGKKVHYYTTEPYPLPDSVVSAYSNSLAQKYPKLEQAFNQIHAVKWGETLVSISPFFAIEKYPASFIEIKGLESKVDLVFFDAFAPDVVPELWTADAFLFLNRLLKPDGILVTYSAKGSVKRALRAAGFLVESLPGPPGKREVTRAIKT